MADTLLALGANLGDPVATLDRAAAALEAAGIAVRARSRLYRTPPWGPVAQPDFVNACLLAGTDLPPRGLLATCQAIERALGRVPGPRWGPRALDIDILDYDGLRLDTPGLALPHPRLTERAFVLVPLADVAPDRRIGGRRVAEWAETADRTGIVPLDAPGWPSVRTRT